MSNNYLMVLHNFANAYGVHINSADSKKVGKFTVTTSIDSDTKTYWSVPIIVSDRINFGVLTIDWDEYGFDNYSDYGLYQEYSSHYCDFEFLNNKLLITNSDPDFLISIY